MDSIKIVHTADLHLGSPMANMGVRGDGRRAELNETFANIVSLALNERADALLICGDLFDSSAPDTELVDFTVRQFRRIPDIRVFIVLGNHDYDIDINFPPNVYVFGKNFEKVSLGNVDIYGASFGESRLAAPQSPQFTAENTENINIMLWHGDVGTTSVYNPIGESEISNSRMDYIALGHVHSHGGFLRSGNTCFSYCGIPEGRAFDEDGTKGVAVVEVSKGNVQGKFVPVCCRKYLKLSVDIDGFEDNFETAESISAMLSGKENAYRIYLRGRKRAFLDLDFIKNFLEREIYYTELVDETSKEDESVYSLKSIFAEKCRNENALRYGLAALRGEKVHIE